MSQFLPREAVRKKRDNEALTKDEIQQFIAGVSSESIPDYQVAAMLMAIFFRGLSDDELAAWADAMLHSGDVLKLDRVSQVKVDKHSTGGVGDKISIPLAPAVAACGVAVPMISGRGLGHTGGTLDKLESIPGFQVDLSVEKFHDLVAQVGCCLIGQTAQLAPADRRLYALRDVTATVESIPLIASSIMSKKLAEGIDALVLDCKVGSGAFMKTLDDARQLAKTMRVIGKAAGKDVRALLTNMDQPIGHAVGHALEIEESIDILQGNGPADTRELTVRLGAEMLVQGGVAKTEAEGAAQLAKSLDDGSALEKFREIVSAQSGDPKVCDNPTSVLDQAPDKVDVLCTTAGFISAVDAQSVGMATLVLGGGRRKKEDKIDYAVGISTHVRVGDKVEKGQPLVTLHHRNGNGVDSATERILSSYQISGAAPEAKPLIHEILR